jgi:hypothetical protein
MVPLRRFEAGLVVASLVGIFIALPPLISSASLAFGRGGSAPPEYCLFTKDASLACVSKKLPGQGAFFVNHYCKISHYGTDCVTCIADIDPEATCQQPGKDGTKQPGYVIMEEPQ